MASEDGYFAWYAEHAKNLRTALIGYGVGALALFITNENANEALKNSESPKFVVFLFVCAVAIQIFLVLVNKYLAWLAYDVERKADLDNSRRRQIIDCLSEAIYFDLAVDLIAGAALLIGTYCMVIAAL